MNQAELRQWFYAQLSREYAQGEMQSLYHWCVSEIHGWSRVEAYTHNQDLVSDAVSKQWRQVVERLKKMEPIQYIFGKAQFMDLELKVTPNVLIPRPETEELVQLVLDTEKSETLTILDIGTGSGCIPLALKYYRPTWEVRSTDISIEALDVAMSNASMLSLKVDFFQSDIRTHMDLKGVDVVVSNPPYIPSDRANDLEANVLKFEPHLALFSPENDPFYFFKRIAELAARDGVRAVYFETHATDMKELIASLSISWQGSIAVNKDLSGKERFLVLSGEKPPK